MIEITYFGKIREALGCERETILWQKDVDTDTLLTYLRARGEPWQSVLQADQVYKVALNHRLLHMAEPIPEGAKIGILPPVTGG